MVDRMKQSQTHPSCLRLNTIEWSPADLAKLRKERWVIELPVFTRNRFNHWILEPFVVEVVLVALKKLCESI